MRRPIESLSIILMFWALPSFAEGHQWRSVLVDKLGTRWSYDESSHRHKPNGEIELWVKKVYDPPRMAATFQRFNTPPSAYDLELWSLLPDRRITLIEAVRYRADDTVLETYHFMENGKSPVRAFPPDSAMDGVWSAVTQKLHSTESQGASHRHFH